MRYTFLLYSNRNDAPEPTPEQQQQALETFGAYIGALKEAGIYVDTDWLQPTATATTVSMNQGKPLIQDGPFAETKEQLGGYFVVETPDLDTALEWAGKCPVAYFGKVEVRPSAMPEGQK